MHSLKHRKDAAQWAAGLLTRDDWVILDTETTGLDVVVDRIVQIAIINHKGETVFNTLLNPHMPIPADAQNIHGITDGMVKNAPNFEDIYPRLVEVIKGKLIIIYNAGYDWNLLVNASDRAGLDYTPFNGPDCAMEWYSQWIGEYNYRRGNYKWLPLPGGDHSALGDCLAVLALIREMAASLETEVPE